MSSPQEHSSPKRNISKRSDKRFLIALSALLPAIGFQPCGAKDKFNLSVHEKQPALLGRVTDTELKPLAAVQLRLTSPDNNKMKVSAATKPDGSFEIAHDPCKVCRLEVIAPKGSQLASALLDNLSGESTRRLVIELHEGFEISGRITGNGKGLKGLDVTLVPVEEKTANRSSVHGSGLVITGKTGAFALFVTAGQKRVTVDNDRYPDFAKHFSTKVSVTAAGAIPDIELPSAETSQSQTKKENRL
jgi:hypothetical protein